MRSWAKALAVEMEGKGQVAGLFNIPAGALRTEEWRLLSRLGT